MSFNLEYRSYQDGTVLLVANLFGRHIEKLILKSDKTAALASVLGSKLEKLSAKSYKPGDSGKTASVISAEVAAGRP